MAEAEEQIVVEFMDETYVIDDLDISYMINDDPSVEYVIDFIDNYELKDD